jgi:hypothetical protein
MSANTPEFDALAGEGGNPLGGAPVSPPPAFSITLEPTEWPDINDVIGPPPEPPADPEVTLEVPVIDFDADPGAQSALAALDNGSIPTPVDVPESVAEAKR